MNDSNEVLNFYAHWLRRGVHVAMITIPWLYYFKGNKISNLLGMTRDLLVLVILAVILVLECIRLKKKWLVFGQRHYESRRLSSMAWGAISVSAALLLAPKVGYKGAAFGAPLIISLALVDPFIGELRIRNFHIFWQLLSGWILLVCIWGLACIYLGTPLIYLAVVPLVTVFSEFPNLKNIDDNFLIIIVPLLFIIGFHKLFYI